MKHVLDVATDRRSLRFAVRGFPALASSAALAAGLALMSVSPAAAAGSTSNAISVGATPSAGSKGGSYLPSASASSGDKVLIGIASTSTGCSLVAGRVDFTGAGTCVVNFNDPGNTSYAAAALVQRSTTVYSANKVSASKPPIAGSTGGSYSPGASATSGDAVVRSLASTSTGCTLASFKVTFTGAGTCRVVFSDAGNGAFAAAADVRQTIKVYLANIIHAGTAPANGTINGTYAASAWATSGDKVVSSLDGSSTGCSIDKGTATFTANGVCLVNFNDAGNGAFAKASQVQQSITVGSGNPIAQVAIVLTSIRGRHGHPLTLTSSGGSGSGAVTYKVSAVGSAGCWISGGQLHSTRAGTCLATVTKSADATYASAKSLAAKVTILAMRPKTVRTTSAVWTGRTVTTTITGSGFYGSPLIVSNAGGTRVVVLRDTGHSLRIRVTVAANVARGVHTFTIVFAHGQIARIRYLQR